MHTSHEHSAMDGGRSTKPYTRTCGVVVSTLEEGNSENTHAVNSIGRAVSL